MQWNRGLGPGLTATVEDPTRPWILDPTRWILDRGRVEAMLKAHTFTRSSLVIHMEEEQST
jgi:hypothetical protein